MAAAMFLAPLVVMVAKWSLNPFAVQTMRNREESIRHFKEKALVDGLLATFVWCKRRKKQ